MNYVEGFGIARNKVIANILTLRTILIGKKTSIDITHITIDLFWYYYLYLGSRYLSEYLPVKIFVHYHKWQKENIDFFESAGRIFIEIKKSGDDDEDSGGVWNCVSF